MINKPALHDLMRNCDSKYQLVVVAAKRARDIIDHDPDLALTSRINAVSLALRDVADGKIHYVHASSDEEDTEAE